MSSICILLSKYTAGLSHHEVSLEPLSNKDRTANTIIRNLIGRNDVNMPVAVRHSIAKTLHIAVCDKLHSE